MALPTIHICYLLGITGGLKGAEIKVNNLRLLTVNRVETGKLKLKDNSLRATSTEM